MGCDFKWWSDSTNRIDTAASGCAPQRWVGVQHSVACLTHFSKSYQVHMYVYILYIYVTINLVYIWITEGNNSSVVYIICISCLLCFFCASPSSSMEKMGEPQSKMMTFYNLESMFKPHWWSKEKIPPPLQTAKWSRQFSQIIDIPKN